MTKRGKQASRKAAACKYGFLEVPLKGDITELIGLLSPFLTLRVMIT
ncbi:MAG: hypothetical protein Q8K59_06800 [Nitrosomonas sp.]|nr:hypothetical protein [Nitrosomonas sp.]MDP1950787.1 hypothetical protein [Nitrosomonas sp.]